MENASKALLMAGGILVAILIMTIGVYLFTQYKEVRTTYDKTAEQTEIQKFNTNFTKFEGRTDITAQEIVTIVNYVENIKNEHSIELNIICDGFDYDEIKEDNFDFLKESNENDWSFTCKSITPNDNGVIKKIVFQKN